MTYPILASALLALAAVTALATVRLPRFGRRMAASAIAAMLLVSLTAIFDNVMISAGLFHYPSEHLSGLRIGLAPVEDFSYPIAAAFLVPAAWTLAGGRRERADHEPARRRAGT